MSHCQARGSEVILGNESHIFHREQANLAQVSHSKNSLFKAPKRYVIAFISPQPLQIEKLKIITIGT